MDETELLVFVKESNKIENVLRPPTKNELSATKYFLDLPFVKVEDLENFVRACVGAPMRVNYGMDVRVGEHVPPRGGPHIKEELQKILDEANDSDSNPFKTHVAYETLHPFMDGNGRSGRALWAWQMLNQGRWPGLRLGFLHAFYYQTLSNSRSG